MTRREETIVGSDDVSITIAVDELELSFRFRPPGPGGNPIHIYLALGTHRQIGAAILPFVQYGEGSTVFLPFKSDLLLSAEARSGQIARFQRRWERWRWSEREQTNAFTATSEDGAYVFRIPRPLVGEGTGIRFVIYAKDPNANNGWGWFWGCSDPSVASGLGDKYIPHYHELRLDADGPVIPSEVEGPRGTSSRVPRGPSTPRRSAQDDD